MSFAAWGFNETLGAIALGILWLNTLLVVASTGIDVRLGWRRVRRLGPFQRVVIVRGDGPEGAFARHRVHQRGRARRDGPIVLHDRGAESVIFGGEVRLDDTPLDAAPTTAAFCATAWVPPADGPSARVWVERAAQLRAAGVSGGLEPAAFVAAQSTATRAKGWERDVDVVVRQGQRVWLSREVCARAELPAGKAVVRAGMAPDATVSGSALERPCVVSRVDPWRWTFSRTALALGFCVASLALAAGVTVLACWPPLFGTLSTLGGAAGLGFFLLVQPAGVAVRDALRPPDRAYVRGVLRAPRAVAVELAPRSTGQPG